MVKNHLKEKDFFSVFCVCTGVLHVSMRASPSWRLFINLTDVVPEEEIRLCLAKSILHVIPSTRLFLFMCACSPLSLTTLVYIIADLTFGLSIHLPALSSGLSDWPHGSFKNP